LKNSFVSRLPTCYTIIVVSTHVNQLSLSLSLSSLYYCVCVVVCVCECAVSCWYTKKFTKKSKKLLSNISRSCETQKKRKKLFQKKKIRSQTTLRNIFFPNTISKNKIHKQKKVEKPNDSA